MRNLAYDNVFKPQIGLDGEVFIKQATSWTLEVSWLSNNNISRGLMRMSMVQYCNILWTGGNMELNWLNKKIEVSNDYFVGYL